MTDGATGYPVKLSINYPDRELNRLTSFFRIFMVIPIAILLALIIRPELSWEKPPEWRVEVSNENQQLIVGFPEEAGRWSLGLTAASFLALPTLLMILFRQKYPKWWFDWNVALIKFSARVASYLSLMNDQYPATDEEQWVQIEIPYPDVKKDLIRWYPLVKWLLAFPHYILLAFLYIAVFISVIIAWLVILFTRRYPKDIFSFVTGVFRWDLRVLSYAFLLVTDKYPPFRLNE
jgi:hypothetical protein